MRKINSSNAAENYSKRPLLVFKRKVYECDKLRNKQDMTPRAWKEKADIVSPIHFLKISFFIGKYKITKSWEY